MKLLLSFFSHLPAKVQLVHARIAIIFQGKKDPVEVMRHCRTLVPERGKIFLLTKPFLVV
jgi:hypothetical protein